MGSLDYTSIIVYVVTISKDILEPRE